MKHNFCYAALWLVTSSVTTVDANPISYPYIPFRTSPLKQSVLHHELTFDKDPTKSRITRYDPTTAKNDDRCPLQFSLGMSKRVHNSHGLGILQPPIIFPAIPSQGPGRQVLYVTQYEHLDMMTPSKSQPFAKDIIKEALVQHVEYPMLFESSAFLTSPIVRDVNNDGIPDVILADYDGGIYAMGLDVDKETSRRYFHKAQVPRLYVRRHWMESLVNETLGLDLTSAADDDDAPADKPPKEKKPDGTHDPYHSYFEYVYGSSHEREQVLRGVTANVLGLEQKHVESLTQRRSRKMFHKKPGQDAEEPSGEEGIEFSEEDESEPQHRRLQEVIDEPNADLQQDMESGSEPEANKEEQHVEGKTGEERIAAAEQLENAVLGNEQEVITADGVVHGDNQPNREQAEELIQEAAAAMQRENENAEELDNRGELDEGMTVEGDQMQGDDEYSYRYGDDMNRYPTGDDYVNPYGDDYSYRGYGGDDDGVRPHYEDDYPRYDDYYGRYNSERDDYYDEKHYIRITPHILCTPVLVEFPKLYNDNGEVENFLFVAVSYYMDEDEYEGFFSYHRFEAVDHGDESEVQRGMFVASALMVYQFGDHPRWGRQEHLDLSGDPSAPVNTTLVGSIPLHNENTKMGAFALGSPTVADIDGDGNYEVLVGTSMGFVYGFDARNLYSKDNWPVQFNHGIESRILVEDVVGDTNLEIFVADVGGNVVCLDHKANKLWHRDLVSSATSASGSELLASSQMVLGDVDGDGTIDVAIIMKIREPGRSDAHFLFALSADTGKDLANFPVHIWGVDKDAKKSDQIGGDFIHEKLPAPLLVDLHENQDFLKGYLERNGAKWTKPTRSSSKNPPHGGNSLGLHIVQPVGSDLIVMEAGSGCIQTISIGDKILSMVQADDVHGTNNLDLVISTTEGNIVTLESPAPFHPLNVWNNGEIRGISNTFAHGYSASQGIFVHDVSREYRDIFGVYVPVTFEIFDNRPNIMNEPDKRVYKVEIRTGTSKPLFRRTYQSTGIYTERFYIPFGPGYYTVTIIMKTTHGLIYEDTFHLGYNVNYMDGFATLLWLPLVLAFIAVLALGQFKSHWDDDDYEPSNGDRHQGILGGHVS